MSVNDTQKLRFAVVGGGMAGLAAAEELGARGHAVEIFEAGASLGGRISPEMLGEREISLGGKNIGSKYTHFRELLARRGHSDYEFFGPDSGQLVRGKVRTLSFSNPRMRARIGARLVTHAQVGRGLRFLKLAGEVKREDESKFLGHPFFADLAAETGDPALPDYLAPTLCQDVIRHMTVRMNGAEPHECHIGNVGSNLALVVDKFDQLSGPGYGPWIREVEADHVTHLSTPVSSLVVEGGRVTGVVTGAGEERSGFDGVVLAAPAHKAAAIVSKSDPDLSALLGTIRYFPVGIVVAEYDRPAFPDEFAALTAPHGMALSNAGSYGLSDRHIVRWTFSGEPARGRVEPHTFDPEALLQEGESFLAQYAPIRDAKRVRYAAQAIDPGLCAYRRDHATFLRQADNRLNVLRGLALAGDYVRGASLEACVRSGEQAAERVATGARAARGAQAPAQSVPST
jgi:oxygen-dependent protoporphyrinogen oxidase